MTAWWEGLAEVDAPGPPGAETHRLVWRAGTFRLAAHRDPDADRALRALGGERCPCLDVLDAWTAAHVSGGILVTGARSSGEHLQRPEGVIRRISDDLARWRGAAAAVRAEARSAAVVERVTHVERAAEPAATARLGSLLLLTLDRRLQLRLQASVAATLAEERRIPALTAAAASRALPRLRALGWSGDLGDVHLGAAAALASDHAVLPVTWLASVWGRGLHDAVDGALVLSVTSVTSGGAADVIAAAPGKPGVAVRVDQWENA